jgi:peroxiredoxin (alkyl hydroperoxide reductase subunit C)
MALCRGDRAPEFELPAVKGRERFVFRSKDYLGRMLLVVTFHPLDWTPTCESQVPILNGMRGMFEAAGAQVIDISVDSIESHIAWQEQEIGTMHFPLCSDYYPPAEVTQKFGILREEPPVPGISERAAFVIDRKGMVRYAQVYPIDQLPDLQGLLGEVKKIANADSIGNG